MKQGFTLLELLITIAILAILTTVVVVAINPAESIKRARDTQRMSDLDNIKTGIILYIAEGDTDIGGNADGGCCQTVAGGVTCTAGAICKSDKCCTDATPSVCNTDCATTGTSYYDNDGEGWIPIDFTDMAGGAPLSHLPVDPVNTVASSYLYSYAANGTDFEINTVMESTYYANAADNGKNCVMEKDGGNSDSKYEVGTKLTIIN